MAAPGESLQSAGSHGERRPQRRDTSQIVLHALLVHLAAMLVLASSVLLVTCVVTLTQGQESDMVLRYDYKEVLNVSLLFYEAQRSGRLPIHNRVSWRGDSCLEDRGARGEDLSGGYFTQGTTVKFTFPNAAATTVLAWGALNYEDGYRAAELYDRVLEAVKWGADHLVKCHASANELYAVIGDVHKETSEFWGRPEDIRFPRAAAAVSVARPGSEVAAESAAALAASSLLLRPVREAYLTHARDLYELAKAHRGDYHLAVPSVSDFYKSWSGDQDELVWAAAWLYRATREQRYLADAENMYRNFHMRERRPNEFSWDNKDEGVKLLLYQLTLRNKYKVDAREFCDRISDTSYMRTPKGLFHNGNEIGSLRYAANAAFLCFNLGETLLAQNEVRVNPYINLTISQIHYVLGDTGRSFVVGFGENPPQHVFHSAASCRGTPCDWDDFNLASPNPHVLYGALVGGPDGSDRYEDTRHWRQNGVAVDHNAGFQSAVAGLMALHQRGKLPEDAYVESTGGEGLIDIRGGFKAV